MTIDNPELIMAKNGETSSQDNGVTLRQNNGAIFIKKDGKKYIPIKHFSINESPQLTTSKLPPTLLLKLDDLFLMTDKLGNISGGLEQETVISTTGLFCEDTRFLSRLELKINGELPIHISSSAEEGFALSVLCCNPVSDNLPAKSLSIKRQLVLDNGLWEEIEITNYHKEEVHFTVSLSFDADFKDFFEVRGHKRKNKQGTLLRVVNPDSDLETLLSETQLNTKTIKLAYQGADYYKAKKSQADISEADNSQADKCVIESQIHLMDDCDGNKDDCLQYIYKQKTAVWELSLKPHGTKTNADDKKIVNPDATKTLRYRLELVTHDDRPITTDKSPTTLEQAKNANEDQKEKWSEGVTKIECDNKIVQQVIDRAKQDIFLLRQTLEGKTFLSAGIPRFSTLFGRDSLIAALQTLILDPTIAKGTLEILAQYQGTKKDLWRQEEPGKILHELRRGELARLKEITHTPYYGTVDATPLWLILYAEYYAWTKDTATLDNLWLNALAAMKWIDGQIEKSDRNPKGYLRYRGNPGDGLANQGWRDSGDALLMDDGTKLPNGPITLCEVQAYVYAAKIKLSRLAEIKNEDSFAQRWKNEAEKLKKRFNQDFWINDLNFCALGLDGKEIPLKKITSSPGHCLYLDIFDCQEKANLVAERLLEKDMFNGYGIRTVSNKSDAYSPISYHNGSVWPHDNSFIAVGLRKQNHVGKALQIAEGMVKSTFNQLDHRPPELFTDYQCTWQSSLQKHPEACPLQAWATGGIFQLLQVMVNLEPDAHNNTLTISQPTLPDLINKLTVSNLQIGSTVLDLELERTGKTTTCKVVNKNGNLTVKLEK